MGSLVYISGESLNDAAQHSLFGNNASVNRTKTLSQPMYRLVNMEENGVVRSVLIPIITSTSRTAMQKIDMETSHAMHPVKQDVTKQGAPLFLDVRPAKKVEDERTMNLQIQSELNGVKNELREVMSCEESITSQKGMQIQALLSKIQEAYEIMGSHLAEAYRKVGSITNPISQPPSSFTSHLSIDTDLLFTRERAHLNSDVTSLTYNPLTSVSLCSGNYNEPLADETHGNLDLILPKYQPLIRNNQHRQNNLNTQIQANYLMPRVQTAMLPQTCPVMLQQRNAVLLPQATAVLLPQATTTLLPQVTDTCTLLSGTTTLPPQTTARTLNLQGVTALTPQETTTFSYKGTGAISSQGIVPQGTGTTLPKGTSNIVSQEYIPCCYRQQLNCCHCTGTPLCKTEGTFIV